MKKPKEKPSRSKAPGVRHGFTPKALAQRGADKAGDKMREQFKDAAADRPDGSEEYGVKKLEQGVSHAIGRGEQAVKNVSGKAKEKALEKVNAQASDEHAHGNPARESDSQIDAEPVREHDVWRRPQTDLERQIKTKESYARSQADTEMPLVREKPQSRPMEVQPANSHVHEKADTSEVIGRSERADTPARAIDADMGYIKEKPQSGTNPAKGENVHPPEKTEALGSGGKPAYTTTRTYQGGKELAEAQAQNRSGVRTSHMQPSERIPLDVDKSTVKVSEKGVVKSASKGTVKTAETAVKATGRSLKTAQRTTEGTARTVKATAKTAQKAGEVATKAAKATAEAAARTAKVAAKAAAAAFKAIVAAIKGLVAAIAAGGWVAVVVMLALALVGLLLCTAFGVFSSNESEDGSEPMTAAITQIDMEFKAEIDQKVEQLSAGDYDEVVVEYMGDMDGDSAFLNNWNDVLATYAVLLTADENAPTDVVAVTPERVERLRQIFRDMNIVQYDTEVITETYIVETEDGEEEEITYSTLYIYITVDSLDYLESAALYRMTDKQFEVLDAMMSPGFATLFAELIGVDVYGGANLMDILSSLPASGKGAEVVKAALTKLGAPYVLGAKGENRFDCSGFVYWAISQVDPALGSHLYTSAAGQAKYCYDRSLSVGESKLIPGDLVFWQNLSCEGCTRWQEVHHVGIYIGDGNVIEASSSQGRVIIRNLWSSTTYPLFMYARPSS